MNILFVGEYYPCLSYQSIFNEFTAMEMFNKGHDLTLLSDSWCTEEKNFMDCIDEIDLKMPFSEKFFVDPIELKHVKNQSDVALIGLGSKVVEMKKPDLLFITDIRKYGLLAEVLKRRYNIHTVLSVTSLVFLELMTEAYYGSNIIKEMEIFDEIHTFNIYENLLKSLFNKNIIVKKLEINNEVKITSDIHIFCFQNIKKKVYLMDNIVNKLKSKNKIVYSLDDELHEKLSDIPLIRIIYVSNPILNDIPKNSLVLDSQELIFDYYYDITRTFILLIMGYTPIINKNNLSLYCNIKIEVNDIDDDYVCITAIEL